MHILLVIVEFAVVLGIMVLVHEFGHFAVAKLCGVRVETFSIGFGPRIFGVRYGDTDYRLSLLPLGGYVKMSGDAPGYEPEEGSWNTDEFNAHPRWQRILIALAGPASNFILSFFLLTLVAHYHYETEQFLNNAAVVDYVPQNSLAAQANISSGDTIEQFNAIAHPTWKQVLTESALNQNRTLKLTVDHNGQPISTSLNIAVEKGTEFGLPTKQAIGLITREQTGPIGVTEVQAGSPAERSGLKNGDQIERIDTLSPHSVPTLLAYLKDRNGAPAVLQVQRNGQPVTLLAQPEKMESPGQPTQYRLGFQYLRPPVDILRLPLGEAVKQSLKDNAEDSTLILRVLKGMFTRHVAVSSLSGPVGIAQQIDMAAQLGTWTLLQLMSTISLNLGIFNLLPLPILDGGMIVFLLIESLIRRDVNVQIKERIYQLAFVCFILFFVFVMFNDITKMHLGH